MVSKLTKEQLLTISKKEVSYLILKIARLIKVFGEELLSDDFKSHDEFMMLDAINDRPGMSQKEMADKNVQETSRVSKILSMFEKNGLVKKIPAVKNNKLINELHITKKGKEKLKKNEPMVVSITNLTDGLFSDVELIDFKDRLVDISEKLENCILQNSQKNK